MNSTSFILLGMTVFAGLLICKCSQTDGFLNINCGAPGNETVDNDLLWISDSPFIKTRNFSLLRQSSNTPLQYLSLAYFTNLAANKYCYQLPVKSGTRYLIRATFHSAAFGLGIPFANFFDLYVGRFKWTRVDLSNLNNTYYTYYDIIMIAEGDRFPLCLTPSSETEPAHYLFISTIELRPLKSFMYNYTDLKKKALLHIYRTNFGTSDDTDLRYPEDRFDRIWQQDSSSSPMTVLSIQESDLNIQESLGDKLWNKPPVDVLLTASQSTAVNNITITDAFTIWSTVGSYYVALYFCNINNLSMSGKSAFQVFLNDHQVGDWIDLSFGECLTTNSNLTLGKSDTDINLLLRPSEGSEHGPFINGGEVYKVLEIQSATHAGDVLAIHKIAEVINVPDDWAEGDPCFPNASRIICSSNDPPRVIVLNLTSTGLKGNIPPIVANLTALQQLFLGNNNLSGSIPDLSTLNNLQILQLQGNQLTGGIPRSLEKLSKLNQLFLQDNQLNPTVPPGLSKPGLELRVENQSNFTADNRSNKIKGWMVGLLVGGSAIIIVVMVFISFLWRQKRISQVQNTNCPSADDANQNEYHRLAMEYTEEDIKMATNNYSTIIGKGAFGSVYSGRLSGYDVAVKLLAADSNQGQREFQTEVNLLSRVYHKNLVNLIGYCRQPVRALVYEYMHLGALKDHLYGVAKIENPVEWRTRMNIALQAAQGLFYLHEGCNPPIIHRDIKCTNILLDKNMSAKLADFGLSKLLDSCNSYISTVVKGTPGYLDPEYFETSLLTEKSDVYSFGVVLLEIISGVPPNEGIVESARKLLSCGRIVDLMDPSLGNRYNLASAWKVAEVAYTCVESKSINRPKMSAVVKELDEAKQLEYQENSQSEHISVQSFHMTDTPSAR